jgi:hypothetical protein
MPKRWTEPLSVQLIHTAERVLIEATHDSSMGGATQSSRQRAQAIVHAVLLRLGGKAKERGLFPVTSDASNQVLELADQVEAVSLAPADEDEDL